MTAGFGLEKLGLLSLRHPWICLLLVALVTPIMAYGASQLRYSSDVREIFRSDDPAFQQLDLLNERFPESQPDLQIVVESKAPFNLDDLTALKALIGKLEKTDGVTGVLSFFSAVTAPEGDEEPQSLIPEDLSKLVDSDDLRGAVTHHPLIARKLLSDDWRLALLAVSLRSEGQDEERRLVETIRTTVNGTLADTDLTMRLTGVAVIRDQIVSALARDQRTFGLVALVVGLGLCWVFLRRVSFIIVAAIPAAIAVVWLRGGMWLFGQDINLLTGIAPTIILVIVLSDCLHLLFSIRRRLIEGEPLEAAIERAVKRVGPACVLTSLTTAMAMASLIWMPHSFIAHFGITTASATALALVVTLLLVPALSAILLRGFAKEHHDKQETDPVRKSIESTCRTAANAVATAPRAIALIGLILVAAGFWVHTQNEPQYSYMSNLPPNSTALAGIQRVHDKLAGANTIEVLLDWPPKHALRSYRTLEVIREVHKILASEPEFGAVTSLHTVEEWLGGGEEGEDRLLGFLESETARSFAKSFVALDENAIRISAQFRDLKSAELEPILNRLQKRFQRIEQANPGLEIAVTGIVPVSSRASHTMIKQLNRSLIIAIGTILLLIGVGMRSVRAGLASVLPNLFPIAMGGVYLYFFEGGLEFTSLVAFSVGFGIAVDSTIHFLNRYRLERSDDLSVDDALQRSIMMVGPVVIMSTVLIASGIGTTLLSSLPMVQLYGTIVVIVLLSAVVGTLLFLPAVMSTMEQYWPTRWKRKAEAQAT